jgi:hypothetical protein
MTCYTKTAYLLPLIVLVASSAESLADVRTTKIRDTVVDSRALTIKGGFGQAINGLAFQQDAVVTHGGYQYVGYYSGKRQVCIARRKLPAGNWETMRFKDYDFKSNDAHNTISIGVCPKDGTIHISFDHHNSGLHYRVSRKGIATRPEAVTWGTALFGPVTGELEEGKAIEITYPRFLQTPDGGLQFCYRRGGSGDGDRMLADYDPKTGKWINTRQIDSRNGVFTDAKGKSRSRCSYPNGYDYGPYGKLHATWVWRESSQGANHDLMYAYSEDRGRTWLNNAGQKLEGPPAVNSPGITVVNIPQTLGLMNTHGQAVDSEGRIHVVMWHCSVESLAAANSRPGEHRWGPPEARRYHHYWRDKDGKWERRELPGVAGNRPKLFVDKNDNVYLVFRNNDLFVQSGDLVIATATAASRWTDWKVIHTEKGPFVNEMLADPYRWKMNGILSVMVQGAPEKANEATSLRILDFTFRQE